MAHWAVIIPPERYATERLVQHESLTVDGPVPAQPGDDVLVVAAGEPPAVVALARVADAPGGAGVLTYTRRFFDEPGPASGIAVDAPFVAVEAEVFRRTVAQLGAPSDRRTWLVSLDLPIEAATAAEAVRQFWSYVLELGPAELPAFVSPSGDELAMQAFVLGEQANQDPEED